MSIRYRSGYKYQLSEDYCHYFSLMAPFIQQRLNIQTEYVWLCNIKGDQIPFLQIKKGYAWDGPSGPTIDTTNFMRGSLVHDALYQLIRLELLDKNLYRRPADLELYRICRDDGMNWFRANVVYYGLRMGGNPAARRSGENPVLSAP